MTLRTKVLREKVRSKVVRARKRWIGMKITLNTLMMTMDMTNTHQRIKNKIRNPKEKRKKKNLMVTSGVEKMIRKNQSRLRIASRWLRPL